MADGDGLEKIVEVPVEIVKAAIGGLEKIVETILGGNK